MEATTEAATEIVPVPQPKAAAITKPTTPRAIIMAEALKEDTEQRALLAIYIRTHMLEGIDYGVIPGTQKPTLLKPGAEKLTDLFRCTPEFEQVSKVEEWERGLFHYEFRCRIRARDTGQVLAEGVGSANSREARYRWRDARRVCPHCGKDAIIKGKQEYGGGWICFGKKGGCGAKWGDGAAEIEGQEIGRVENDDVFTLVNTILKMAKKRALVDGAIALARCSDVFTQDVEDMDGHDTGERPPPKPQAQRQQPTPAAKSEATPAGQAPDLSKRRFMVAKRIKDSGADFAAFVSEAVGQKASNQWTEDDLHVLEAKLTEGR